MIDLAYNINAFFGDGLENNGLRRILSRSGEPDAEPGPIAVTPDIFYTAGEVFTNAEVRPLPLRADGRVDLSALAGVVNERTWLVAASTADLETGVLTSVDELASAIREISDANTIAVDTIPSFTNKERTRWLRDELEAAILDSFAFARSNAAAVKRLPNVSNISFDNMNGEMIAAMLFDRGFSAATGCACSDSSKRPSMTLRQMNISYSRVIGSMHFSFGDDFGKYEAETFINALTEIIEQIRGFSFEWTNS